MDTLTEMLIVLPSNLREQTGIASDILDMEEELVTQQHRLTKTRKIKQGMMQELLIGKTRLLKPEQLQ